MNRFESFTNLGSGVKRNVRLLRDFSTVVAIILGGLWALYTWNTQRKDRAEGERAALEATIYAEQESLSKTNSKNERLIRGFVNIKNVGSQETTIVLNDKPVVVARIEFDKDYKMEFLQEQIRDLSRPPAHGHPDKIDQDRIRPQETDHIEFLVKVRDPGTYVVMFSAKLDEAEVNRLMQEGRLLKGVGLPRWETQTFVEFK